MQAGYRSPAELLRGRAEVRPRRLLERVVAEQARHEAIREPEGPRELMPELYEEIARLPERYRAPIVLCYLEGQSHEEAARTLRCRLRTLQTRLQRGKAKLRLRLLGRGLAPGTGLLAVWLAGGEHSGSAAAAAMTPLNRMLRVGLSESTARASVQFVAARMDIRVRSRTGSMCPEKPFLESTAAKPRPGGRPSHGPDPDPLRTDRRG